MQTDAGPCSTDRDGESSSDCRSIVTPLDYGLVAYVEGRLGDFLYNLRQEVVPSCRLRTHVSVLPPRTLAGTEEEAVHFLNLQSAHMPAFQARLGNIEVFDKSKVIYVAIARGGEELVSLYRHFNGGAVRFVERYPYHPHITLAQEIPEDDHRLILETCERRWLEYDGPREFPVETLTFVKKPSGCNWADITECRLVMAAAGR